MVDAMFDEPDTLTANSPQPQEVGMPGGPTTPGGPARPNPCGNSTPSDTHEAREYLAAVLRAARSDAVEAGADPDAVAAGLRERLRRVRQMPTSDQHESPPGNEPSSGDEPAPDGAQPGR
jgi:hypothetical protein